MRISEVENDGCNACQGGVVVVSDGIWPFTTMYVATCTDILTISTCNTANFDTRIAVYEGCSFTSPLLNCSFANLVACADGGSGCGDLAILLGA